MRYDGGGGGRLRPFPALGPHISEETALARTIAAFSSSNGMASDLKRTPGQFPSRHAKKKTKKNHENAKILAR